MICDESIYPNVVMLFDRDDIKLHPRSATPFGPESEHCNMLLKTLYKDLWYSVNVSQQVGLFVTALNIRACAPGKLLPTDRFIALKM